MKWRIWSFYYNYCITGTIFHISLESYIVANYMVFSKVNRIKGTMCCFWSITSFFVYICKKLVIYIHGITYTAWFMPWLLIVAFVYLLASIQMTLKKCLFSFNACVCLVCLQVSKTNTFVKWGTKIQFYYFNDAIFRNVSTYQIVGIDMEKMAT